MKGRSPPRDDYLIRQYEDHREWFRRIRSLTHQDRRLAEINRDPNLLNLTCLLQRERRRRIEDVSYEKVS